MIKTLKSLFKQDKEKYKVPKGVQDVIPMVEHSDYIISYVQNNFGGAARTLKLAENRHLRIIEI